MHSTHSLYRPTAAAAAAAAPAALRLLLRQLWLGLRRLQRLGLRRLGLRPGTLHKARSGACGGCQLLALWLRGQ